MADYVKRIRTSEGDLQIDYKSLANLPDLTPGGLGVAPAKHTHAGTDITSPIPIDKGGTGATNLEEIRKNLDVPSTSVASASTDGLMSASDKAKLDKISEDANSVSFESELTSGTKIGTITIGGVSTDIYCSGGDLVKLMGSSAKGSSATPLYWTGKAFSPIARYDGNAASATKLSSAITFSVNLASENSISFDGTNDCTIGVSGVLPITKGGTGSSNKMGARTNLGINYGTQLPESGNDGDIFFLQII